VERIGPIEDADMYLAAKSFAQSINSGDVKVKHANEESIKESSEHEHF